MEKTNENKSDSSNQTKNRRESSKTRIEINQQRDSIIPNTFDFQEEIKNHFFKKLLKQKTSKEFIALELIVSIFHSFNKVVSKLEENATVLKLTTKGDENKTKKNKTERLVYENIL